VARTLLYSPQGGTSMSDVILVSVTVGFFVLAWAYALACDRL
jgi:hypothetical protein